MNNDELDIMMETDTSQIQFVSVARFYILILTALGDHQKQINMLKKTVQIGMT